jgi:hypothetical protein
MGLFSAIDNVIKTWYGMGMNDTSENSWVQNTFQAISVVVMLTVLVGCLIAPVFGPWIRRRLVREYAMEADWEKRVNSDMTGVMIMLWLISAAAWAFVLWCNLN